MAGAGFIDNHCGGPLMGRPLPRAPDDHRLMTQSETASATILVSGAVHAVVNAIFKSGGDKMASRALIDGFSAALVAPAAFFLSLPDHAWGWLAGSVATHLVYLVCLIRAFERADMSVAYPIARGAAPALAAGLAVLMFAEPISASVAAGVALVSTGVMTVGLGRHVDRGALAWALATGVSIATYTVIDAQGVRAAPSAASYICWEFLVVGGGVGLLFALWRGPVFVLAARAQWPMGLTAGALSIVTYGLAMWAFRLGATPRLAALREISILFGVAIAIVFLKERVTAARLAGIASIGAGAAILLAAG
jgi:drug/metabolite transporter (DMT)-like permease